MQWYNHYGTEHINFAKESPMLFLVNIAAYLHGSSFSEPMIATNRALLKEATQNCSFLIQLPSQFASSI